MVKIELSHYEDISQALESDQGVIVTNSPKKSIKDRSKIHHPLCHILKSVFFKGWGRKPNDKIVRSNRQTFYHFDFLEEIDIEHAELCDNCKNKHSSKSPIALR